MSSIFPRRTMHRAILVLVVLAGLTACEDSTSSTTLVVPTTIAPAATVAATGSMLCNGQNCAVGDTGPGGGIIIRATGTATFRCGPAFANTCNTIEMAPAQWHTSVTDMGLCTDLTADDPNCVVSKTATNLNETNSAASGNGWQASLGQVRRIGNTSIFGMAMSYRGGGKADWHVPYHGDFMDSYPALLEGVSTNQNAALKLIAGARYWSSFASGSDKGNFPMVFRFNARPVTSMSTSRISIANRLRPVRTFLDTPSTPATTANAARPTSSASATTTTAAPATTSTTTIAISTTTLAPTCAQGGSCVVGDIGPGSGTVYYVSSAGFSCGLTLSETCRYLEVSPTSWKASTAATSNCTSVGSVDAKCVWGTLSPNVSDTSGAVGRGRKNSKSIIDTAGALTSWATAVSLAYRGGGKSDWFLPSQHELDEMCKFANGKTTGDANTPCTSGTLKTDFYEAVYWSSNDSGGGTAIAINFRNGQQTFPTKDIQHTVRPVRAF